MKEKLDKAEKVLTVFVKRLSIAFLAVLGVAVSCTPGAGTLVFFCALTYVEEQIDDYQILEKDYPTIRRLSYALLITLQVCISITIVTQGS